VANWPAINRGYHFESVRAGRALRTNGFKNGMMLIIVRRERGAFNSFDATVTVRPVSFWLNQMTGLRR